MLQVSSQKDSFMAINVLEVSFLYAWNNLVLFRFSDSDNACAFLLLHKPCLCAFLLLFDKQVQKKNI